MDRDNEDAALWFFGVVVEPTVADFLKYPWEMRLGCLACLALDSMVEHYFYARPSEVTGVRNPGALRGTMGSNWAFKQVSAVAKATKHVKRDTRREGLGFEDVRTRRIDLSNLRAGWPISGDAVMVDAEPGSPWLLSQLVSASMEMWRVRLGVAAPG